jgi:hypothetical protein
MPKKSLLAKLEEHLKVDTKNISKLYEITDQTQNTPDIYQTQDRHMEA